MNEKINQYIDALFKPYDDAKSVQELKHDLLTDLSDRYEELRTQGKDEQNALANTIESIGDIEETLHEMALLDHETDRQDGMDFSAQNHNESDFAKVVLHHGKFHASAMKEADFSNADLTGSSFKSSDLWGANFSGANLTGAKFVTSTLDFASFKNADLTDADFSSTSLSGAVFDGAQLTRTKFYTVDFRKTSFGGSSLAGTDFHMSDLSGINFEGLVLSGVIFDGTSLQNSDFRGAILKNVSFRPFFAITNKYYKMIKTIHFGGASMDKLTYNALKGMGADLDGVTIV